MNNDAKTKQVILVRTDLDINVGKIASQVAHASVAILLNKNISKDRNQLIIPVEENELEWFNDRFTKTVLAVQSEAELLEFYNKAKEKGLSVVQIKDKGFTFFNGKETLTTVAIGPDYIENIDELCGSLPLLKETVKEKSMRKILQKLQKKIKNQFQEESQKIKELLWGKN